MKPSSPSIIPTEKSKPTINPLLSRILLFGQGGTGRSVFASQFPATYFDLAGTAQYLEIKRYPTEVPSGWKPTRRGKAASAWQWFVDGIDLCIRDPGSDMLVIDTIDRAFELCFEAVCAEHGVESPEDNMRRMRQIYGQINREYGRMLARLRLFPGGLILIANEATIARDSLGAIVDPSVDQVATRIAEPEFKAKSPTRHRLRSALEELAGVIGRATVSKSGDRVLVISARESVGKDRTGLLPAVLPLTYDAFCEPFRQAYTSKAAPSL